MTAPSIRDRVIAGITAKVNRARSHVGELDSVIEDWIKNDPQPVIRVDRDGDWEVATAFEPLVPPLVSVILGEIVHDLRSSLDHAIFQAVRAQGFTPGGWNYFPVTYKKSDFELFITDRKNSKGNLLKGALHPIPASHPIYKIVRDNQPYNRLDPKMTPWGPEIEWLAILHRLWNIDKHRMAIRATLLMPETEEEVLGMLGGDGKADVLEVKVNRAALNQTLEDEIEVARFRFSDTSELHTDMKDGFPGNVFLHCTQDGRMQIRFGSLVPHRLVDRVVAILKELERFL